MWIFKRSAVGNCLRIEYDDVCKRARFEEAAMIKAEVSCRQSRKPSHCFREQDHLLVTNILTEQSRKISISARVRRRLQEVAFRCYRSSIRTKRNPGLADLFLNILFAHQEIDSPDA